MELKINSIQTISKALINHLLHLLLFFLLLFNLLNIKLYFYVPLNFLFFINSHYYPISINLSDLKVLSILGTRGGIDVDTQTTQRDVGRQSGLRWVEGLESLQQTSRYDYWHFLAYLIWMMNWISRVSTMKTQFSSPTLSDSSRS